MMELKKFRMNAGLSQKDVSEALGYSTPQFISNVERGISYLPIKDLKKISELYKLNFEELLEVFIKEKVYLYEQKIRKNAMESFRNISKNRSKKQ